MQLHVEKCKRTVALIFHDRCLDSVCVCVCLLYSGTSRIQRRLMASRFEDVALEICETIKENQLIRTREEDENWYSPVTIK